MEQAYLFLIGTALILILGLGFAWGIKQGILRGALAMAARAMWCLLFFLCLFPRTKTEYVPDVIKLQPIHVLIDDSLSMKAKDDRKSRLDKVEEIVVNIKNTCQKFGCEPKVSFLSELDPLTKDGFTPLSKALAPWFYKVGSDPWMLFSDGGDFQPLTSLTHLAVANRISAAKNGKGLIVGFKEAGKKNIWLSNVDAPFFAFESKPLDVDITIKRDEAKKDSERVQLQIILNDNILASSNTEFRSNEDQAEVSVTVPPLAKGYHLMTVKVLPTEGETDLWDNVRYFNIEVLANTVGVLHLLGSPSWDGRFLRRYLKSEPKYDLISFFILRDPWDSQLVNERELSLIPFPVERLFKEELSNFKVVIIQNFSLFQFLLPEFQERLVKFIKDGGGLFFLGGPRALKYSDISSSFLKEILPFSSGDDPGPGEADSRFGFDLTDSSGPFYDPDLKISLELAKPSLEKRALATVYDEWEKYGSALDNLSLGAGAHHMETVTFKENEYTPLVYAKTEKGRRFPLVVASYPGKGRALWVFSDSLWRLAMAPGSVVPRELYNRFVQASLTWLLRQELNKPLLLKDYELFKLGEKLHWSVKILGPAVRYLGASEKWQLSVCGEKLSMTDVNVDRLSIEEWVISGNVSRKLASGERCSFEIHAQNSAFGSVAEQISSIVPITLSDKEITGAPHKLQELGQSTGAKVLFWSDEGIGKINAWVEEISGTFGVSAPKKLKVFKDHFWIFGEIWGWLLLLGLPLEVVVRRWPLLVKSNQ